MFSCSRSFLLFICSCWCVTAKPSRLLYQWSSIFSLRAGLVVAEKPSTCFSSLRLIWLLLLFVCFCFFKNKQKKQKFAVNEDFINSSFMWWCWWNRCSRLSQTPSNQNSSCAQEGKKSNLTQTGKPAQHETHCWLFACCTSVDDLIMCL